MKIDRTQAVTQLSSLSYKQSDKVYLRFFFPDGDSRKAEDKGRKLEGIFPNLPWEQIEKMQGEGRGCYFVVNGDGHLDRDVKYGRVIFFEHDNLEKELQRNRWKTVRLPEPTLQVDTAGNPSIPNTSYQRLVQSSSGVPCKKTYWNLLMAIASLRILVV